MTMTGTEARRMNLPEYTQAMLDAGREFDRAVHSASETYGEQIGKARAMFEEQRLAAFEAFAGPLDEPALAEVRTYNRVSSHDKIDRRHE